MAEEAVEKVVAEGVEEVEEEAAALGVKVVEAEEEVEEILLRMRRPRRGRARHQERWWVGC